MGTGAGFGAAGVASNFIPTAHSRSALHMGPTKLLSLKATE